MEVTLTKRELEFVEKCMLPAMDAYGFDFGLSDEMSSEEFKPKAVAGFISSLSKKGLITSEKHPEHDFSQVSFTDFGKQRFRAKVWEAYDTHI
jgi:hypothetical protein